MKLPTEKSKPTTQRISMVLYGAPKIGKSTFCSRFPKALFIATEPGLDHLETFNIQVHSWIEILEVLAELAKGKHDFDTVIIDTVDRACALCAEAILDKYNKANSEHPATDICDISYGRGYRYMSAEFSRVLTKLFNIGLSVIFTSHEQMETIDTVDGPRTKLMPSFDERCRTILLPMVDIIAYVQSEMYLKEDGSKATTRVLRTAVSPFFEAGDRTCKLKDGMPFTYSNFQRCMMTQSKKQQTTTTADETATNNA